MEGLENTWDNRVNLVLRAREKGWIRESNWYCFGHRGLPEHQITCQYTSHLIIVDNGIQKRRNLSLMKEI